MDYLRSRINDIYDKLRGRASVVETPKEQSSLESKLVTKPVTKPKETQKPDYTVEEILQMPYHQFVNEHKHLDGAKYTLEAYFNAVANGLMNYGFPVKQIITVRDIVAVHPYAATKLKNIGQKITLNSNSFMMRNYGISLGTTYEGMPETVIKINSKIGRKETPYEKFMRKLESIREK